MWSNNTGDAKFEEGYNRMGMKIDPNVFFIIKTGKIIRGNDFTLVKPKGQSRLDVRK